MKILVDTSAIVAALKRGEQHHAEAADLFQKARLARHGLFLTNFILAETYSLILVRLGAAIARRWLQENALPLERVTKADEARAREILFKYKDKDFSYVDVSSFAVMERLSLDTAFTFDQHFRQYGWHIWGDGQ